MSGKRGVNRSSRLTKLRVTPSASAISAADRYLPQASSSTDAPAPTPRSASRPAVVSPVPRLRPPSAAARRVDGNAAISLRGGDDSGASPSTMSRHDRYGAAEWANGPYLMMSALGQPPAKR
jgi:hypothetical protein